MRVLHVQAYFAPAWVYGGPPRSVLGLCKALQRNGVEVEVLTTTANGADSFPPSPPNGEVYDGIPVRYLPRAWPRRFYGVSGMRQAVRDAAARCDLMHIHGLWNKTVWTAMKEARRVGLPYVVSPRGMLEASALRGAGGLKSFAYPFTEGRNLAAAAALHATSTDEAETLNRLGLSTPVAFVPNGVEMPTVDRGSGIEFRRKHGIAEAAPIVFYLGRLNPLKRLDLLAEAFLQIHRDTPDAVLVIAGPDERGTRARIEPILVPVQQQVHWLGAVDGDEKLGLLAAGDVAVACSDSESFGMSVAEALAAGIPVVVTKTCPWSEIEGRGCGRWVEQTSAAIAGGVLDLLSKDVDVRRAMGDRGREFMATTYSWDAVAPRMAEVYAGCIQPKVAQK